MIKINLLKEDKPPRESRGIPGSFTIVLGAFVAIAAVITIVIVMGNRQKETLQVAVKQETIAPADTPGTPAAESTPVADKPIDTPSVKKDAGPVPSDKAVVDKKTVQKPAKPAEEIKSPVQAATETTPAVAAGTDYAPSTHVSEKKVEEVVADRRKDGTELLGLNYNEMSRGEKITYEISYARKVFELLTRAVPDGIEFSTLVIDSFTVIKATGLGANRELVGNLFRSLRTEKGIVVREKPVSLIRSLGPRGYRFDLSCETSFGPDTADLAAAFIVPRAKFSDILRSFSRLATADGVVMERAMERSATEKSGEFRRYTYKMSGTGTYLGFVKLVLDLQTKKLPCSFSRIRLRARNSMKIAIDADVVFTLRD